jgi:hypothetical protein
MLCAKGGGGVAMNWNPGDFVLSVELPDRLDESDRLLLKPLGLVAAGPGLQIAVPGQGHVNLRDFTGGIPDLGLGQVEVTGSDASELIESAVRAAPDLHRDLGERTSFIAVTEIGVSGRRQLDAALSAGSADDFVGSIVHDVLFGGAQPQALPVMCPQHNEPEICPYDH